MRFETNGDAEILTLAAADDAEAATLDADAKIDYGKWIWLTLAAGPAGAVAEATLVDNDEAMDAVEAAETDRVELAAASEDDAAADTALESCEAETDSGFTDAEGNLR
ncbi:hypothetical protein FRC10_008974 [Ceratobasidium sp. 414]|nr:hypothetical protein FRC10_008974 [Ceratobasidium sp. 414]